MAVQILKILFNAPRPIKFFEGIAPIRTIDGYAMHEWNSFPSGHTASAFTLAVVLSYILPYKNSHLILVPLAVLTAFSRVYLAQHFMEDIIAGSLIAVIMTFRRENLSAIIEDGTSNKLTAIINATNTNAIPIGV